MREISWIPEDFRTRNITHESEAGVVRCSIKTSFTERIEGYSSQKLPRALCVSLFPVDVYGNIDQTLKRVDQHGSGAFEREREKKLQSQK